MAKIDALGHSKIMLSLLHAAFMKIGENDSTHEFSRILQASTEFDLIKILSV